MQTTTPTPERINPSSPWVALPELDLAIRLDRGCLVASPLVSFEEAGASGLNARAFAVDPFTFEDEQRTVLEDAQSRLRRADAESDLYLFDSQYEPVTTFFEERLGQFTLEDLEAIASLGYSEPEGTNWIDEWLTATIGGLTTTVGGAGGTPAVTVRRVRRTPVRMGSGVEFYREITNRPPYTIPRGAKGRVTLVTRDEIHVTLDDEIQSADGSHTLHTVTYSGTDQNKGRDAFFLDTMSSHSE